MSDFKTQDKREILRDKVVALVKDFVKTEGGITPYDLDSLFGTAGTSMCPEIPNVLAKQEIVFK